MRSSFRHITIWCLTGLLLIGQTGVSLHQIYCYCKGEWKASLFAADMPSECPMHPQEADRELPACCKHKSECSGNTSGISGHPCKEDLVVYLQLDKPAIRESFKTWDLRMEWAFQEVFPNFGLYCISIPPQPDPISDNHPPPGLKDGRSIRTWVRSFLC